MIYYSVFDSKGKKIADCGNIHDAITLVSFDPTRSYRQVKHLNPETVNVSHIILEDDLQLPEQKILSQSELKPFIV